MKWLVKFILIILLTLFHNNNELIAQNKEPEAFQFIWGADSLNKRILQPDSFPKPKFLLGWEYPGSSMMTRALEMNLFVNNQLYDDTRPDQNDPILLMYESTYKHISGFYYSANRGAYAVQWEPTLKINNPGDFKATDEGYVFGFEYIRNNLDTNDGHLILNQNGGYIDSIVAKDPWIRKEVIEVEEDWFLTINLRRKNLSSDLSFPHDSTVLTLRIRYETQSGKSGYIKFDCIPDSNNLIHLNYNNFDDRGYACDTIDVDNQYHDTLININKNLLPTLSDSINGIGPNITISTKFKCNNDLLFNNPFLKNHPQASDPIIILNPEIIYKGNCDVAIDWLRIENLHGQEFYRGMYDSTGPPPYVCGNCGSIYDVLQHSIDTLKNHKSTVTGDLIYKLYRFYGQPEVGIMYWSTDRYMNRITNGMMATRGSMYYPRFCETYTGLETKMTDMSLNEFESLLAVPYLKWGKQHYSTLGLKSGYGDLNNPGDTIKSGYETQLKPDNLKIDSLKKMSLDDYLARIYSSNFFQPQWERNLNKVYLHNVYKQEHDSIYYYLYSEKPWTPLIFIGTNFYYEVTGTNDTAAVINIRRPKTGEELNLLTMTPILFGAKGLYYDREQGDMPPNWTGVGHGHNYYVNFFEDTLGYKDTSWYNVIDDIPDSIFLYEDNIGSDFLDLDGWDYIHYLGLNYTFLNYAVEWINDSVPITMGIPRNRIYVGRKSARLYLKKLHQWINEVEDTLYELRLSAWFGKGLRPLYHQDPKFTQNDVINNFISTDSADWANNIRPIGREKQYYQPDGEPAGTEPYYEPWDSTFFDITLLRDKNDTTLSSNVFYVGVQNRRTDPLIHYIYDEGSGLDSMMLFLSTAEFEALCDTGGHVIPWDLTTTFKDTSYWQNLWWKRLGCREISIPFNYTYDTNNTENYALLHVTELGKNTDLNTAGSWWSDSRYYNRIDTIIGQDKEVVMNMLPGEGKILRVEVLEPPDKFDGLLTYSNQRKMVSYPIRDSSGNFVEDSIFYHAVYYKPDINDGGKMKVYYRRSLPVYKWTNQSNIVWQPTEKQISMPVECPCSNPTTEDSLVCAHPSIVVRTDDNNEPWVHVVFECKEGNLCTDLDTLSSILIAESVFSADSNYNNMYIPKAKVLGYVNGSWNNNDPDAVEWGNPMINNAGKGNYYTWADSIDGIGIGYRSFTNDSCFDDTKYIKYGNGLANHPSLNSYSRIDENEDECALVWEESWYDPLVNPPSGRNIHYSRIKLDNNDEIILDEFNVTDTTIILNNDSTIVKLNGNRFDHLPVVYRGLDYDTTIDYDRIAWYGHNNGVGNGVLCSDSLMWEVFPNNIKYKAVYTDSSSLTSVNSTSTIYHTGKHLKYPDIAQGHLELGSPRETADSTIELEFSSKYLCEPNLEAGKKIWHLPHGYHSLIFGSSDSIQTYPNAEEVDGYGIYSHLAARKENDGNLWKNRRIFELANDSAENTDLIVTSSQFFYKTNEPELKPIPFIGFANQNKNRSMIAPVKLNNDLISYDTYNLLPKNKKDEKKWLRGHLPDTIKTNWFTVGSRQFLEMMTQGIKSSKAKMLIERKSDRQLIQMELRNIPDSLMEPLSFSLINGNNDEYRLLFINQNSETRYTENIVIMHEPEVMFEKTTVEPPIVDLGKQTTERIDNFSMTVYPNPAGNEVYVTILLPTKTAGDEIYYEKNRLIQICVYSPLGEELFTDKINSGKTITIPTNGYSNGLYFIRAEKEAKGIKGDLIPPVTKSFVIER